MKQTNRRNTAAPYSLPRDLLPILMTLRDLASHLASRALAPMSYSDRRQHLVHQRETQLPEQSVILYDQAVEILLRRRQQHKAGEVGLSADPDLTVLLNSSLRLRTVMEGLAYTIHREQQYGSAESGLPRGQALTFLEQPAYLRHVNLANAFLNYVDEGAGLLVGQEGAPGQPTTGVEDMSGNVWEWTRSLWGENATEPTFKYPYKPDDGRENLHAPDEVYRVLRGGAFRDRNHARLFDYDAGFRVVVAGLL